MEVSFAASLVAFGADDDDIALFVVVRCGSRGICFFALAVWKEDENEIIECSVVKTKQPKLVWSKISGKQR